MNEPRSVPRLFTDTLGLYRRYPWLFLVLAAAVIVPYELIALVATGTGPFSHGEANFGPSMVLGLTDSFLVTPLVSALHIHAVAEVRRDRVPQMGRVAIEGLKVLPVVAAATIVSWLGIVAGFLALVIPGIVLTLRWAVVAQAAAIEHEGWLPSLRRSGQLSAGHYVHVAIFIFVVQAMAILPMLLGGIAFDHGMSAAAFLTGLVLRILVASFVALASALLYFDLVARWQSAEATNAPLKPAGETSATMAPLELSWDPRNYADQDRPEGWYVNPTAPGRMRHWGGSDRPEWGGEMRTPRQIRKAWYGAWNARS